MTNSKVVVFLGPSLPVSRAKELLPGDVFLPPARQGDLYRAARERVRRLMARMGLWSRSINGHANYPASWTSDLSGSCCVTGDRPSEPSVVRRYRLIPMRRGFHYLIAIMDWSTRKVLSWRVSNTMDGEFCIEALEEALARFGCPEIFNTDQGSQFTSPRFTGVLEKRSPRGPP